MKLLLTVLLFFLIFNLIPVYAHPFLDKTIPESSSTVAAGLTEVIIYYSESIDVNFSNIKVLDGNGNQIDNKDTNYFENENSLIVTTPPLQEGAYTVTTKVLSKIDGHLVDYAFIFGVGNVNLDTSILEKQPLSESVFFPESIARYPGLVGQTIILGSILSLFLVWGYIKSKKILENDTEHIRSKFNDKLSLLLQVGILAVLCSNIAMLAVQTWRLDVSPLDAIQTSFGLTWTVRMIITVSLLGLWFVFTKSSKHSSKIYGIFLGISLVLIGTTTLMGHGAASENTFAIILDYVHNLVSSAWIGGVMFYGLVILPTFSILSKQTKENITLITIPKFSKIFVVSIGILIITGPLLLWFLESDVSRILSSSYGIILVSKISLAAAMVCVGAFNQFQIFANARKNLGTANINVYNKLKKSLKIEILLGLFLLIAVSMLTNSSLPAGEIQEIKPHRDITQLRKIAFSESAKFEINISPFTTGPNTLSVKITDSNNNPLSDVKDVKVKISNPLKNIHPIEIPLEMKDPNEIKFVGDMTFGFSGIWKLEFELQRSENKNENFSFDVLVKPHLENFNIQLTEFEFPEESTPLYPILGKDENLWISDPKMGRIWSFNLQNEEFTKFSFQGKSSIVLESDNDGLIWFTDIPQHQIGYFDPNLGKFETIDLPLIMPYEQDSIPISMLTDNSNNIWITITNKDKLIKFELESKNFTQYDLPRDSGPFALALDQYGKIWFSLSDSGKIGYLKQDTGEIIEFSPQEPLQGPEAIVFDNNGILWIAEHTGNSLTKFNPVLEHFEKIDVPDKSSLPFGMVFDKYQNIWFAQHVVDKIGIYDPENNEFLEVKVPSSESFIQFGTIDAQGNIWFVEQKQNKLLKITILEQQSFGIKESEDLFKDKIRYSNLVGVGLFVGIVLIGLAFVKSIHDNRKLDKMFQ